MTAGAPDSGFDLRRFLLSGTGWPYLLVPFIPIAIILELTHASASIIFITSALGVIPTAALMGRATEELAARSGPGIGGFLNVTFGNAPELIIAFFALNEGLQEVVKASLIGSILGNILLVMGAAMFIGGRKRERQKFDRTAANVTALMLLLAVVAMIMPALFELVQGEGLPRPDEEAHNYPSDVEQLSIAVAIVLLLTYVAGPDLLAPHAQGPVQPRARRRRTTSAEPWSVRKSVLMLAVAGVAVGADVGDPRRLDQRGVGVDRPLAVLRRRHRRRDRRQRRRALGRDLLRGARQDGPRGQHRDRLRAPRSRCSPRRCSCCSRSSSATSRWRSCSTASSSARSCSRSSSPSRWSPRVSRPGSRVCSSCSVYAVLGLTFYFV